MLTDTIAHRRGYMCIYVTLHTCSLRYKAMKKVLVLRSSQRKSLKADQLQ